MLNNQRLLSQGTKQRRKIARIDRPSRAYALPSKYLKPLSIEVGQCVVIVARVSTRKQRKALSKQIAFLKKTVKDAGGIVVTVIEHIGSGARDAWQNKLTQAAMIAIQESAVIVAESSCRVIRSQFWTPDDRPETSTKRIDNEGFHRQDDSRVWNNTKQPSVSEFELVRDYVLFGVEVQTVLEPDADLHEVRSQHTKRGNAGRPRKSRKSRWQQISRRVAEMLDQGLSLRVIANETGLSQEGVRKYRNKMQRNKQMGLDMFAW